MTIIDIGLGLSLLIGAYYGYKSGFLMELFALVAIILGVIGGFKLLGWAMILLSGKFDINAKFLPFVAFAVVFFLILFVINLLGKTTKAFVDQSFLGSADKAAGGLLGLLRTTFMFSVVFWIIDSLDISFITSFAEDSWLYPKIAGIAPVITDWIGSIIPLFKDVL